jgi:hypothetical protein
MIYVGKSMAAEMHHLSVPPPILKRGFWLYVWRVGLPGGGYVHYVGMTGDTRSARAQSTANRVAAHLSFNINSNALRRYMRQRRRTDLEDCRSLDFFAFGPVYQEAVPADYPTTRGKVAALDRHLWLQMEASGYEMLNAAPRVVKRHPELPPLRHEELPPPWGS